MDNHPSENSQPFVPPRHWIGPEELEATYWSDPKVREKRSQEFFEKPVELIDAIDQTDKSGLQRREFLTIMGASMAMASLSCARRPVHKIIPYVIKPEEITYGVPNWYASTYREGGHAYGILVKTREGRPIKIEGNPDHPLSQGRASARAQAAILDLYDPDRLKTPLSRARGGGSARELAWTDADAAIQAKLKDLAARGGRVRVLTGELASDSTRRLIKDFLGAFGNGQHVEFDPLALEEISAAQELSYGTAVMPHYRFEAAELVVSLGADFMGTWPNAVEYMRNWSKTRDLKTAREHGKKSMSKLVAFEPMITLTGANADERYPVRPGDEYKIAMALAHEILLVQKHGPLAGDSSIGASLQGYAPEKVAEEIGLKDGAAQIKRVAHELVATRGRSLVVGGGLQSRTQEALALHVAVNLLNSALGNEGVTVDGTHGAGNVRSSFASLRRLIDEMKGGRVDALIICGANVNFQVARSVSGFEDAVAKVPFVVAVSDRDDETAQLADYVIPESHFLESWGDAQPMRGIHSIQQPTIAPLHSTRAFEDSLLVWIKGAGLKTGAIATQSEDYHAYLQANWKETIFSQARPSGSFEEFWESTLRQGVFIARGSAQPGARSFRARSLEQLPKYAAAPSNGLVLALYASISMQGGDRANNPWLQEFPDPVSSITWDNFLNVAPDTAKKMGLAEHDVVELNAGDIRAELPVHVQPGMHPNVVAVAVGYGRRAVGKVGNLAGVNVYPFVRVAGSSLQFAGQAVTLRKTGRFYRLAATQWHTATENRPIVNDITLTDYQADQGATNHTDPHLKLEKVPTIWPTFEYKGYRWGMAIDLTSCTGCGACMIACQAENNVPVVGREQVRNARNMHWIRIDRYYSGSPENPDVIFQPMLCQHCENAPCETVCPVLATVHNSEGLNVQVYNRCVGTRYCQNNCPYKVRRFNFFDHWKSYEGTMNLAWNPDVTVRTRGIMEKCTFCVQRIRDSKDKAKDLGGKIADGTLRTACQQTCPTDAIVFGDINDPTTQVSQLRADARAFRSLEILNTKPSISYLTKVRNKEGSSAHHPGAGSHGAPDTHESVTEAPSHG